MDVQVYCEEKTKEEETDENGFIFQATPKRICLCESTPTAANLSTSKGVGLVWKRFCNYLFYGFSLSREQKIIQLRVEDYVR